MNRRVVKRVAGALVVLIAIGGLIVLDAHRRATAIFGATERELCARIAAIKGRHSTRLGIASDPSVEDAWPRYAKAVETLSVMPVYGKTWGFDDYSGDDQRKILAMLPGLDSALEEIRAAVRSRQVTCPFDFEKEYWEIEGFSQGLLRLKVFLEASVIHRQRAERHADALDLVVLLLEVPRDEVRFGGLRSVWLALNAEQSGFQRAREILSGHSLSAEELRRFARALDRLGRESDGLWMALEVQLASAEGPYAGLPGLVGSRQTS